MSTSVQIKKVLAREVLDSRGFPTVEVELHSNSSAGDHISRAIVPSGASTGEHEALELRDGDQDRYLGKGVTQAVSHVREKIATAILEKEFASQALFDELLIELDGTATKEKLGANALLATSMAFARAHAKANELPLYQNIAKTFSSSGVTLPVPLMNILNGGQHADNGLDIQEFMIVPAKFKSFKEALRAGTEVFHHLKKILLAEGLSTGVGDEGGFAPVFPKGAKMHEHALSAIMSAISNAGYKAGKEIFLALDSASSEFVQKSSDPTQKTSYVFEGKALTSSEMIKRYSDWIDQYPIISIEDGLAENDWDGWVELTEKCSKRCQLVGDDLFVTNPKFLRKGIDTHAANSILIKLNQIGTVSETLSAIQMAHQANYNAITSHRSGETEDTFIADLAVGTDCGQIKTGSACRTDRLAKYNQLLRIEEELGSNAKFAGVEVFSKK